ncbi:hypothetical protein [Mesorhizobium sp. Pch-S]|nr:hypothetical protein [Mesorhizobium sp. Pch-S]
MTLLIALIANGIYEHEIGRQFIGTGWIVSLWALHLVVRSR